MTDQFAVQIESGTLTILPRSVRLTSGSAAKTYDGKALTETSVAVSGDGFVEGEGASYQVSGSRTIVGTSENSFSYILNPGTKAENYEIETVFGTLQVIDREAGEKFEITLEANSGEALYDGLTHEVGGFVSTVFTIDGVEYTVSGLEASAEGLHAGTYPVEITGEAVVTDSEGRDVTDQFTVNIIFIFISIN